MPTQAGGSTRKETRDTKRDHNVVGQENGMDTIPDACQIEVKDLILVIRLSSQKHSLSKDLPQ